jgi:3-hydroxymyristoyl/3-hydroxydecanoyl-(acyl carrier protein) dehydratase
MVDRILAWQPRRSITGVKAVSFEEYSLKSPWGSGAALPESLVMESLFQLGNWLIMLSSDFAQMGLLVRIEEVQFHQPLGPGQSLKMDIEVASYRKDGVVFNGVATLFDPEASDARAAEGLIASGTGCLATPVALEEFHNPADLKVLFSEIHRPIEKGPG